MKIFIFIKYNFLRQTLILKFLPFSHIFLHEFQLEILFITNTIEYQLIRLI